MLDEMLRISNGPFFYKENDCAGIYIFTYEAEAIKAEVAANQDHRMTPDQGTKKAVCDDDHLAAGGL